MVTELKPELRKLPFDDFVNMMCRPMASRDALEAELAATFPLFSGGTAEITPSSLRAATAELGRPIDPLVVRAPALAAPLPESWPHHCPRFAVQTKQSTEMIREASSGASTDGKVSRAEFCAMMSVTRRPGAAAAAAAGAGAAVDVA
jgi:hypothetical protein